jgi:hypothetical protein
MNILTEQLPTAVEIDGQDYPINTDFRDSLRVILAFEDTDLTGEEKSLILLENLYPAPWPDNLNKAVNQGIKFLNGGEIDAEEPEIKPRLYSFDKDSDFIFAAYKQTHNIDLADIEYLHWWKFLALFMDLGSETTFNQLIGLRKRLKSGRATKEERAAAKEIRDLIDLPEIDSRTVEEREAEAEFLRLVEEGRKKREEN